MGQLIGISLALGLIAYVSTIGAVADLFFPEPEVAEMVQARAQFVRPLPCDVLIRQRSVGEWSGTRCYTTKSTKEGQ